MIKKTFKIFLVLVCITLLINIPVTTRRGINGVVLNIRIPFYIKTIEFIDRNFWYKKMAREITRNSVTDTEKALAIFEWVTKNIHKTPGGFDVIDDHTLNIAIRRYGEPDQMADLFATLVLYAGVPSFHEPKRLGKDRTRHIWLAYVLLDGKWRAFDAYHGIFFLTRGGEIAAVGDIISDISIVKEKNITYKGAPYEDYFTDLKPVNKRFTSKEEKQIPLFRIIYELKSLFGYKKKTY